MSYPDSFYCSITTEVMRDPVMDAEGNSYERSAIEEWLARGNTTSPVTRSPLTAADLRPNRALRELIEAATAGGGATTTPTTTAPGSGAIASPPASSRASAGAGAGAGGAFTSPGATATATATSTGATAHSTTVTMAAGQAGADTLLLASVLPPDTTTRPPADVVCVVDTSGSMGTEAKVEGDSEATGLNLLDIVKHGVRTVLTTLASSDRLAIVAYSSKATVALKLTHMDRAGQGRAEAALTKLRDGGQTNLHDGLFTAMDLLDGAARPGRNQAVMLLTDGLPNVVPPRGHMPMLRMRRDKKGAVPAVHTFGFGYQLDSGLLDDIARFAGGSYSFIPTSTMVGTAFVHALANIISVAAPTATLSLEPADGVVIEEVCGGLAYDTASWGTVVHLDTLRSGQRKDVLLRVRRPSGGGGTDGGKAPSSGSAGYTGGDFMTATLTFRPVAAASSEAATVSTSRVEDVGDADAAAASTATNSPLLELAVTRARVAFVDAVQRALADVPSGSLTAANARVAELAAFLQRLMPAADTLRGRPGYDAVDLQAKAVAAGRMAAARVRVAGLLDDTLGQVTEALSRREWFDRWGRHYLPSLVRAHQVQACNNFKDPGVQFYGGKLFRTTRDEADALFIKLPPPTPTPVDLSGFGRYAPRRSRASAAAAPAPRVTSMRMWHNRNISCFDANSTVALAAGGVKHVGDVAAGDVLATPATTAGDTVVCVLRTRCMDGMNAMCVLPGGLKLTPYHPVRVNGVWTFPKDLVAPAEMPCPFVYSFIMASAMPGAPTSKTHNGVVVVNGVEAATLGHGMTGDVIGHAFYGTRAVVANVRALRGWHDGLVDLQAGCAQRDPVTDLVVRLVQQ